jgi:hypothetical protein
VEQPKKKGKSRKKKNSKRTGSYDQKTLEDLFEEVLGNILKKMK